MSFVIGIRYLCGRAVATHVADRERAEWPLHPDRVFMAMVAAYFQTDQDPVEREALEWLERQPPPGVICSHGRFQDAVTVYVPVNDTKAPRLRADRSPSKDQLEQGLSLLPERRSRQPRQFPTVVPEDDTQYLIWDGSLSSAQRSALESLCRKVTSVGHSSSVTQLFLVDALPEQVAATIQDQTSPWLKLYPQTDGWGRFRLRVPFEGRVKQLEEFFRRGQRPPIAIAVGYEIGQPVPAPTPPVGTYFSPDLMVLRQLSGPRFPLESTLLVTQRLRDAVMSRCPNPLPEWLTGHAADGSLSRRQYGHLALIPLAHVGRQHAGGHVLGWAIVVPRDVARQDLIRCLHPLLYDSQGWPRTIALKLGALGECQLQIDDGSEFRLTLQPRTWTGPARRWATVTPICLDRHPKAPRHHPSYWLEVEEMIRSACERIGAPRPAVVTATPSPLFTGVPHAGRMPKLMRKNGGGAVQHTHAVIVFDQPVLGPVLLGAGRYRGYGLCRPMDNPPGEQA